MSRRGAIICDPGSLDPHRVRLGENDAREIATFRRFLSLAGPAPLPGTTNGFLKEQRGWLPYVLGAFLELRGGAPGPPPGSDDLPFTAWQFPA